MPVLDQLRPAVLGLRRRDLQPGAALRAAAGVALTLAVGVGAGSPASAVAACAGAFSVGVASLQGGYRTRVQAMLGTVLAMGASTFVGAVAVAHPVLAVAALAVWGFLAGTATAFGPSGTVVGIQATVALLIAGSFSMTPQQALWRAVLVAAGGLLQTLLVVAVWPLRTYGAEREGLATAYLALAEHVRSGRAAPPPTAPFDDAAARLGDPHPLARDSARHAFRSLLDQGVRARAELTALLHARERATVRGEDAGVAVLDEVLAEAADALAGVAALLGPHLRAGAPPLPLDEHDLTVLRPSAAASVRALQGQLRAAERAARRDGPPSPELDLPEHRLLPALSEARVTLRAALDRRSDTFRHALRLAVVLAVASTLSRVLGLGHAYWLPLTAMVVLRPDFSSTLTRGVTRVVGTAAGALLATVVSAELRPVPWLLVALLAVCAFAAYAVFRANQTLFALFLTCYVVFLLALVGLPGRSAAGGRLLATLLGGALALAAYAVWPTWERTRVRERLAALLDAQAAYACAVLRAYASPGSADPRELTRAQSVARRARAAAEASVERAGAEQHLPVAHAGQHPDEVSLGSGTVAAMQRSAVAVLTLQARLPARADAEPLPAAGAYADVLEEFTAALAAALRGAPGPATPDLRAAQLALARELGTASVERRLLALETDEVTDAYDTVLELASRR
ncbi:putative membrane protein YccC [Motilibacter rhizosphaerae]|uniref:Putative membrane protein YccC n=1 Tax=Motilibacter rhizosphaerae TaxID=598652 RepID=A0A4Q7NAX8_9ACTN|nr:FUSC family protein [Motilibacter rhizosphaerae]RZS80025.1 putative membrane protein YccC [Motilibacter rhizosphaerae]